MTRVFTRFPALPAGLANSEAVRVAQERAERPKMVVHGPKAFHASAHPPVKIPDDVVRAMRWAHEQDRKPMAKVAAEFKVEPAACRALLDYRTRSHLDPAPLPPGFAWPLPSPPAPL